MNIKEAEKLVRKHLSDQYRNCILPNLPVTIYKILNMEKL